MCSDLNSGLNLMQAARYQWFITIEKAKAMDWRFFAALLSAGGSVALVMVGAYAAFTADPVAPMRYRSLPALTSMPHSAGTDNALRRDIQPKLDLTSRPARSPSVVVMPVDLPRPDDQYPDATKRWESVSEPSDAATSANAFVPSAGEASSRAAVEIKRSFGTAAVAKAGNDGASPHQKSSFVLAVGVGF